MIRLLEITLYANRGNNLVSNREIDRWNILNTHSVSQLMTVSPVLTVQIGRLA